VTENDTAWMHDTLARACASRFSTEDLETKSGCTLRSAHPTNIATLTIADTKSASNALHSRRKHSYTHDPIDVVSWLV
jgi:hypothetical protein